MLSQDQLTILSAIMGRDVSREMSLFTNAKLALGQALDNPQQLFVSEHWPHVDKFLASERGRVVACMFVDEWRESVN